MRQLILISTYMGATLCKNHKTKLKNLFKVRLLTESSKDAVIK